jgi:hypothetical protein
MVHKRLFALASLIGLCAIMLALAPSASRASSHREAPLISRDPTADNTDLYAFVSPDKPNTVTIIANYIPLEEPAGGPNFASFDDNVRYAINIDNDGDSETDISYEFRFKTALRNPNTFLYNTGPIDSLDDADWNMPQTYEVTRVQKGKSKVIGRNLETPPVNVGPRSTPDYADLADDAVESIDGGIKVFAGQRDDTFWVDLGSIFDLGGLRPFNAAHLLPLDTEKGVDGVGGYNTHAIALQIPIDQLKGPKGQMVIGVYASASRQRTTVLRKDGTIDVEGEWVQVSRLGNPLINEVIIPLGKKDLWNRTDPKNDWQFAEYYRSPELAGLVNLLYPSLPDARTSGRDDLVAILLTGLTLPDGTNLNFTGAKSADLLRLNMAIAPTKDVGKGDPLGVLNGDLAGFPNGRRLEDDVTDIELRAVADGYGTLVNSLFGDLTPNQTPNNQVGDGVNKNDLPLLGKFPYQSTPHQGYEHEHHNVGGTSTPHLN